eukprot:gene8397-10313_t
MSSNNNNNNKKDNQDKEKRSFNDIMLYWNVKDDKLNNKSSSPSSPPPPSQPPQQQLKKENSATTTTTAIKNTTTNVEPPSNLTATITTTDTIKNTTTINYDNQIPDKIVQQHQELEQQHQETVTINIVDQQPQQNSSSHYEPVSYTIVGDDQPQDDVSSSYASYKSYSSTSSSDDNDENDQNSPYLFVNCLESVSENDILTTKNSNWNETFQSILELPESLEKYKSLSNIANDFVYCADTFGKIIISELHLDMDAKTIKPLDLGGVAGGLKYRCQDIIFKFVVDVEIANGIWMYGQNKRSDAKAQKTAGHEIKGLNHFMEVSNGIIRFPLMAKICYRGYTLLAISTLPVNKKTIVYGSCDGGNSVHNSDPIVNKEMERMAGLLNLRGHTVGKEKRFLYGPGDIEVHKGTDGRYYMIDFARIFPPEYPCVASKKLMGREIFYNMLRPELVLQSDKPLSSDGFSGWQNDDDGELNRDIMKVTEKLHHEIIPECIKQIESNLEFEDGGAADIIDPQPDDIGNDGSIKKEFQQQFFLSSSKNNISFSKNTAQRDYTHKTFEIVKFINYIHSKGVNLRYLGLICKGISKKSHIRNLFFTEVIARVWKKIIRTRIKERMDLTKRPSEGPYKQIISDVFEVILNPEKSTHREFWSSTSYGNLKNVIHKVYPHSLSDHERLSQYDLRNSIDIKLLVLRIIQMLNIRINAEALSQFLSSTYILGYKDIEEVGSTVKYTNIIDYAGGSVLIYETQQIINKPKPPPLEVSRWIDFAQSKLLNSLRSIPLSFKVVLKLASTYLLRANITTNFREGIEYLNTAVIMIKNTTLINSKYPEILALLGMIQLKLATFHLFYSLDFQTFKKELDFSRQYLEDAIQHDSESIKEFIDQSLPTKGIAANEEYDSKICVVAYSHKRKIYEYISLVYMITECDDSSILKTFLPTVFQHIKHIAHLVLPPFLSKIIDQTVISEIFKHIPNVETLQFQKISLNNSISNFLVGMRNLTTLKLNEIHFSSRNVGPDDIKDYHGLFQVLLPGSQIENLKITSKSVEDSSFEGVYQNFSNIKVLEISDTYITSKTLIGLAPYLSQLKSLCLNYSRDIKDDGLCAVLDVAKNLTSLQIACLYHLTDVSAKMISMNCNQLEKLIMTRVNKITAPALADIVKNTPNIRYIDLSSTTADISTIESLHSHGAKSLQELYLRFTDPITSDEYLEMLSNLNLNLKVLHLPALKVEYNILYSLMRKLPDLIELKFPDHFHLPSFLSVFEKDFEDQPLYNLRSLDLSMATISITSLVNLLDLSPRLESLSLSAITLVDDDSIVIKFDDDALERMLPLFFNLRQLNLSNLPIEKRQLKCIIPQLLSLRSLQLWGCKSISAQDLYDLGSEFNHIHFE